MKKQSHLFIFLLLFTGVFFSECKKYPEDDVFIQWRRPEKRLIKYGPWVFDKLTVDGVDKSAEFRADSAYFDRMEFKEHNEHEIDLKIYRSNEINEIGLYSFTNSGEMLRLSVFNNNVNDIINYGPIFTKAAISWVILRLSKKGITIKTIFNSKEYILYLNPQ